MNIQVTSYFDRIGEVVSAEKSPNKKPFLNFLEADASLDFSELSDEEIWKYFCRLVEIGAGRIEREAALVSNRKTL